MLLMKVLFDPHRMLSQSPEVSRFDLSCLKILVTGGGLLSATIRMEVMERIPTIKYVREVSIGNKSYFELSQGDGAMVALLTRDLQVVGSVRTIARAFFTFSIFFMNAAVRGRGGQ